MQLESMVGVLGELDHPLDRLTVNLKEVSHAITEIRMDGNNVIGKMKLLPSTPMGQIAIGLVKDSGVRFGVSSRGTGLVNESVVSNFNLQTIDLVSVPSRPPAAFLYQLWKLYRIPVEDVKYVL